MNLNFKLYFKYILTNIKCLFFKHLIRNDKNINIFISQKNLYYLSLHLKLSSIFYSTQLIDIFSYEISSNENLINEKKNTNISASSNSVIVYHFHSIQFQQRFFFFILNHNSKIVKDNNSSWLSLFSISEIFSNANWLEREVAELHGIFFIGKKDLRNLLLPYGDTTAPMKKFFPSIGLREIFYDSINDILIQQPTSIQF